MPTIVDQIEAYLRELLSRSDVDIIEMRRTDLAELFGCAPSQINYVLGTRFTPDRGYIVETRRGGGGFIRISKLTMEHKDMLEHMYACSNETTLHNFVQRLFDEGFLTRREIAFINEMIRPAVNFETRQKEIYNSHLLKALARLLREG